MARMNKSASKPGTSRTRTADSHTAAVAAAHANGLAAFAAKGIDGKPLLHSSSQRRAAERMRDSLMTQVVDMATKTPASRANQSESWRTITLTDVADGGHTPKVAGFDADSPHAATLAHYADVTYGVDARSSIERHGATWVAHIHIC